MLNSIKVIIGITLLLLSTLMLKTHPAFILLTIGTISLIFNKVAQIKKRRI